MLVYNSGCCLFAPILGQFANCPNPETREDNTMDRADRLHLVGRITYYVGWIALLCGALVHLNIGRAAFLAISLNQRNLFEVAVVSFIICMASEVRAMSAQEKEMPVVVKRPAAA
jgi:hypothetical protein